jgi:hypothetical protein
VLLAALGSSPSIAHAQQRPLTTEDPETIGAGRFLFEGGLETGQDARYPLSGLRGDRLAMPLGVSFGLGSIAELQLDGGYTWFGIDRRVDAPLAYRVPADATRTHDLIDLVVATKVRLLSEGARRPGVGVRFATRLPNASNESGLGLDTTDFSFALLAGKTIGSVRIVGNAGVTILSNPLVGTIQSDAFVGGVSIARAVTNALEIVGEVGGQKVFFADVPPVGGEPLGEVRAAARYTRGRTRVDGGILLGFTERSPDFGIMAGVTIVGTLR